MKAWQCDNSLPAPKLVRAETDIPNPDPGELLIRIHAVGVTPTELTWHPTTHTKAGGSRLLAIPGHEFSGVIAATGDGASFELGAAVFGINEWFAEGATAEYCLRPCRT